MFYEREIKALIKDVMIEEMKGLVLDQAHIDDERRLDAMTGIVGFYNHIMNDIEKWVAEHASKDNT